MTRKDLLALAERVEALEGPDRDTDAFIEMARRQAVEPSVRVIWHKGQRRFRSPGPGRIPFVVAHGSGTIWGVAYQTVRYTASLDAAVTLVPEGWSRLTDNTDGREIVELFRMADGMARATGSHPDSLALALTAAALRALAEGAER